MEIRLAKKSELSEILNLQPEFIDEGCCNGICLDKLENLANKTTFIIEENNKILGYAFRCFEIEAKDKTYVKKDEKSFNIDEIYISRIYRGKGYGKLLVKHIENFAKKQDCKNLHVVAVSKNYKELLKFYIDELGFLFFSAWLIKKI